MIKTGLTSVTFRGLCPKEIVNLSVRAGLDGIEWGGDIHVPHGNLKKACEIYNITADSGLEILAYGSYFFLGKSTNNGLDFKKNLDTAIALQAPVIRVWPGKIASADADENYRNKIIEETKSIAALASDANIEIAFESHLNSLTDTGQSSVNLLEKINCKNVKTYWQPIPHFSDADNSEKLNLILPYLKNVHVFHWKNDGLTRLPLADGKKQWQNYFNKILTAKKSVYAILEFVKNDSTEQFLTDAKMLKSLIRRNMKRVAIPNSPLERGVALAAGCVISLNLLVFTTFYYFFGMY